MNGFLNVSCMSLYVPYKRDAHPLCMGQGSGVGRDAIGATYDCLPLTQGRTSKKFVKFSLYFTRNTSTSSQSMCNKNDIILVAPKFGSGSYLVFKMIVDVSGSIF